MTIIPRWVFHLPTNCTILYQDTRYCFDKLCFTRSKDLILAKVYWEACRTISISDGSISHCNTLFLHLYLQLTCPTLHLLLYPSFDFCLSSMHQHPSCKTKGSSLEPVFSRFVYTVVDSGSERASWYVSRYVQHNDSSSTEVIWHCEAKAENTIITEQQAKEWTRYHSMIQFSKQFVQGRNKCNCHTQTSQGFLIRFVMLH